MLITFYQNQSAPNVIPKVKTKKFDKIGTLKNNTSVRNPVIQLKVADYDNARQCNYCYIADFSRYYYIDDIAVDLGGLLTLSLSVDVLQTYAADIRATKALIYRQSQHTNPLIADSLIQSQINEVTVTRAFSGGELTNQLPANANNFVLTTYKGG